MRLEALLTILIIALVCILIYLLRATPPFNLIYNIAEPTVTQIISTIQGYVQPPLDQLQQIPGINYGATAGLTSAVTASVLKYFGNKAKAKLESTIQEKTDELKNHTSELKTLTTDNETLVRQRDDVLTLASDLKTGYDTKLAEKDALIEELKAREQKAIRERNAALKDLTQETQDAIREKTLAH